MSDFRAVQCHRCGKEARVGRTHVICNNLDCGTVMTLEDALNLRLGYVQELAAWATSRAPVPFLLNSHVLEAYHRENQRLHREIEVLRDSTDASLLTAARTLYKAGHAASPFMTLDSGPDGCSMSMKFKTLADGQAVHAALVHFFSPKETPK